MRLLALTGHPVETASARYRVLQFLPMLRARGFEVHHEAFYTNEEMATLYSSTKSQLQATARGTLRRARTLARLRRYDVVMLHPWLHPLTFPPFDWLLRAAGVPVVFDADDAYYVAKGSAADRFRDEQWLVRLMRMAHTVTVGSEPIRAFVQQHAKRVEILPTAIDTTRFLPREAGTSNTPPVIGWVGSPATLPFVEKLYPVFQRLAKQHDFIVRIVGAQKPIDIPGVRVESVHWQLAHETEYFRALDVGLYPLEENPLTLGKHGFKLNLYMAAGIPTVASPVGDNVQRIVQGENGFLAHSDDEWFSALSLLLRDESLRQRIGRSSFDEVEQHASLRVCGERLASILTSAARSR